MKNTSGEAVSDAIQNIEYAGFWVRVAAYFLDYAIIMVGGLVISIGLALIGDVAGIIGSIALLFIMLLYYPVMESSARQATFGKSLAGIKVTDLDGKRLSFGRALLRTIAKILSAIPFSLGFLLAAFTARKQALHDMLAKTLVVRTGPSHLLKLFAMAVGGFVIIVGSGGAYFYYVYLPQAKNEMAGTMSDAMKGGATVQPAPATPQVARKVQPAAPVAPAASKPMESGPDFDNLVGPALTGFEKPGTTRAGPAILELSNFFGNSVWVKLRLPLIKDFDIAPSPEITVNSVLDASGRDYYDSASSFETEFLRRTSVSRVLNPVPHLSGQRAVYIKPGLKEQSLQKIEGQVRISIPVDIKTVAFNASEVGNKKSAHDVSITLKSFSGDSVVLDFQKTSNNWSGVRGYDGSGAPVEIKNRRGILGTGTQIDFKKPVSKVEVLVAANMIERQFSFSLVRGATADSPSPVAEIASPSSAMGAAIAAPVADELEAVYAKFHRAGLTANFDEMLKYGTDQPDLASMPASERQAMLDFLAKLLPKTYTVIRKTIDPDGKHATLHLDASGVAGTIALVKENVIWKVGNADWGGSPQSGKAFPKPAMAAGVSAKRQLPVSEGKDQPRTAEDRKPAVATLRERSLQTFREREGTPQERPYRVPLEKMITPKFNDVMTAVLRQDQAGVTELLDLGWWVDKPGSNGFTPLMETVAMGDAPMAELLLKREANPNAVARDGSVLQIAKRNRDTAMIELLRRYGATVE